MELYDVARVTSPGGSHVVDVLIVVAECCDPLVVVKDDLIGGWFAELEHIG